MVKDKNLLNIFSRYKKLVVSTLDSQKVRGRQPVLEMVK